MVHPVAFRVLDMQVCWRCRIRFCIQWTAHSLRPPPLISIHNRRTGSCTPSVIKVTSNFRFDYGSFQHSHGQCLRKGTGMLSHCLQFPKRMSSANICKLNCVCGFKKYKTKAHHHWILSRATFIHASFSQPLLLQVNLTVVVPFPHLVLGLPRGRIRLIMILHIDIRRKVMFFRKKSVPFT
jgi:hypothetical protein